MANDPIPSADLPLVTPGNFDTVVGVDEATRAPRRFKLSDLPAGSAMEARVATLEAGQTAGMLGYATKADMDADLAHDAGTLALVTNDPTAANNGTYRKTGASGSGTWVQSADRVSGLETEVAVEAAKRETVEETVSDLADRQPDQGTEQNLVWGVGDAAGRMALAVTDAGKLLVGGGEYPIEPHPYNGDEVAGGFDLSWGVLDAAGRAAVGVTTSGQVVIGDEKYPVENHPYNGGDSFAFGFIDAAGNLALGLTAAGELFAPSLTEDVAPSVDGWDEQPIVYSKPYDPGTGPRETVYLVDGEGETRFTDGTFDATHPEVVKNLYVKYASDRDGTLRLWRTSLDGLMEVRGHDGVLRHHIYYGQSNSQLKGVAGGFTGSLTAGAPVPFSALMFNGGIGPNHTGSAATWDPTAQAEEIPAANMTRIIDLDLYAFDGREAHAFGVADRLYSASPGLSLHSLHGVGGAAYADLKKGTQPYTNVLAAVEAGKAAATSLGLRYEVAAVHFFHGESDFHNATYQEALAQLAADLRADTGQPQLRILATQVANWCYSPSSSPTALSPLAQLAAHEAGTLELVTPTYHVPHNNGPAPGDKIHVAAYGVRVLAEKFAQAALAPSWEPLRPTTIVAVGSVITVSFAGRVGSLQFNEYEATTNPNGVVDPGNKGFELLNAGGVTISSVAIVNGGTQVEITCSATVPAGAELAYAYTGIPDTVAGPIEGPRGCLSDSDPTAPSAVIQSHRTGTLGQSAAAAAAALVNWCVVFRKPIN